MKINWMKLYIALKVKIICIKRYIAKIDWIDVYDNFFLGLIVLMAAIMIFMAAIKTISVLPRMKINWINYKKCPPALFNTGETLYKRQASPLDIYWGEISTGGSIFDLNCKAGIEYPEDVTFYVSPVDLRWADPELISNLDSEVSGFRHKLILMGRSLEEYLNQGIEELNENRDSNKTE